MKEDIGAADDVGRPDPIETGGDPRPRILYIHPGPVPPYEDPRRNALYHLSRKLTGDVVTTSWFDQTKLRARKEDDQKALGGFGYHAVQGERRPLGTGIAWYLSYFVRTGLRLSREGGRYAAVVSYGQYKTALAAWIVARLTGARFIVEIPGTPGRGYAFSQQRSAPLRAWVSRLVTSLVVRSADRVRLLYPTQLDGIRGVRKVPRSVFHDFLPTSLIPPSAASDPYILFLGFPWYLKGVDVLIRAFLKIADQFPEHHLRVIGHCPDRSQFEAIAAGHPRIHMEKAVPNPEAMEILRSACLFVLPSRTEAMGRVLLEAMAAGKPVVASNVDGIPYYVRDGETGLLFRSEDADDLAAKLAELLSNPERAARMGERGAALVRELYSEEAYVDAFHRMVAETIGGHDEGASIGKSDVDAASRRPRCR